MPQCTGKVTFFDIVDLQDSLKDDEVPFIYTAAALKVLGILIFFGWYYKRPKPRFLKVIWALIAVSTVTESMQILFS